MTWTKTTRPQYIRETDRYEGDLTDDEWGFVKPLIPAPSSRQGRPRKTDMREVVNGILYMASSGCQWRMLPKDFPPYQTVQHYFYQCPSILSLKHAIDMMDNA